MNIIEVAIDTDSLSTFTRTAPTPFLSPGIGDNQCKSDTIDILRSVGVNTAFGGNHILWETLDMYFNGGHVQGEELKPSMYWKKQEQWFSKQSITRHLRHTQTII